jgi:hypothetical protein
MEQQRDRMSAALFQSFNKERTIIVGKNHPTAPAFLELRCTQIFVAPLTPAKIQVPARFLPVLALTDSSFLSGDPSKRGPCVP